jgi:hypothetical protein
MPGPMHASGDHSHHRPEGRWFWVPLGLGFVGAVCGFVGQRSYDINHHETWEFWSVAYHTLQLFVLHGPHLDPPVPPLLQLGQWLTALSVLAAVGYGLFRIFRAECLLTWTRWHRGHVVICGLGQLGLRLAQEFKKGGMRVVAVEAFGSAEALAAGDAAGLAIIIGDACNPRDLRKAAVDRAKQVIAVCDDEQTNVAIAAEVGEILAKSKTRPPSLGALECWIFIPDVQLRETFHENQVFPHSSVNYRVNVRGLDPFEIASRKVFARSPLDFERIQSNDATVAHLIIIGFGPMGQHLALQAAEIGHFANFQKLRVTIIEREESSTIQRFQQAYPKFTEICDLKVMRIPRQAVDLVSEMKATLVRMANDNELLTLAFCWDTSGESPIGERDMFQSLERGDPANLRLALGVTKTDFPGSPKFLVFQTRKHGFGALFPVEGRAGAIGPQMHAFGLVEEMYTLETLLHERDDVIARALHQNWYENQIKLGNEPENPPALRPWEELPERFKDSNRQAADHIPVKLRAVGYRVDRLREDQPRVIKIDQVDQIELMARMEHQRWCAEKWLQGYVPGDKRDEDAKTLPYLVPWDQLSHDVQDYDRQQVCAIPDALNRAGYGIYPQIR